MATVGTTPSSSNEHEKDHEHTTSSFDYYKYSALNPLNIELQIKHLQKTTQIIDRVFEAETQLYETAAYTYINAYDALNSNNDNDAQKEKEKKPKQKPFPYHQALTGLLDIYFHNEPNLISECRRHEYALPPTFIIDCIRRDLRDVPEPLRQVKVEGYWPVSANAVYSCLLPDHRAPKFKRRYEEWMEQAALVEIDSPYHVASHNFTFLDEWAQELEMEMVGFTYISMGYDTIRVKSKKESLLGQPSFLQNCRKRNISSFFDTHEDDSDAFGDGLDLLPPNLGDRTKILLKVLKHAISDLQRDHRLGRAVLLAMMELKCLDGDDALDDLLQTDSNGNDFRKAQESEFGAETLRYLLAILSSEYIHDCDRHCHERFVDENGIIDENDDDDDVEYPNHYCDDWQNFRRTVVSLFDCGISYMTEKHAEVLSAFVIEQCELLGWVELKDQLPMGWDDEPPEKPSALLNAVLTGLNHRILRERKFLIRLLRYSSRTEGDDIALEMVANSYQNCIRLLVSIGETFIKRLPASYLTENLGSLVANSLFHCSTCCWDDTYDYRYGRSIYYGNCTYQPRRNSMHVISPERYSFLVEEASNLRKCRESIVHENIRPMNMKGNKHHDNIIQNLFILFPDKDIQDVVRGLFLRQLVESSKASFGYGDYLSMCQLPIVIYESMLFEHNVHFPEDEDALHYHGFFGDKTQIDDESDNRISYEHFTARYDLTLLMLNRAWNLPWTPNSHQSYQKPYRQAIKELCLCIQRLAGYPPEILIHINSFVPRGWWQDERAECWRYDCQLKSFAQLLVDKDCQRRGLKDVKVQPRTSSSIYTSKISGNNRKRKDLVVCEGCGIAHSCARTKHHKQIMAEGHGKCCGKPPLHHYNASDEAFCREVVDTLKDTTSEDQFKEEDSVLDNNSNEEHDDDEWESIGSNDELSPSDLKTETVYRYFERLAYKTQRVEEHAFARFYADED